MGEQKNNDDKALELKKRIGLWGGVSLTTGAIVGTGIFVSPVGVLQAVQGSIGLSLLVWILCGLIALLSALCYCELGTTFGASDSDFNNFNLAYGPVVSFLYAWTTFMVLLGAGASCLIFARYLVASFGDLCEHSEVLIKFFAILLIMGISFLNYRSVTISVWVQIGFAVVKFLAMAIIGFGGVVSSASGNPVGLHNFKTAFSPQAMTDLSVSNVGQAFYQGLFPYNGWMILTVVTEEIKDMKRTLPRACILSVVSVIVMYLLVNVGYFSGGYKPPLSQV